MYSPVQNGIAKTTKLVDYREVAPPEKLASVVYCYWQLKTQSYLPEDFNYHVLPDACIDIIFDFSRPEIVTIMTPGTTSEILNLGKEFSYLGIRLFPGVWSLDLSEIICGYKEYQMIGKHSVRQLTRSLEARNFAGQQGWLSDLVELLLADGVLHADLLVTSILKSTSTIGSVADMSELTNTSARQLQRRLKQATGFSPHDFIKIMRLHQSFHDNYHTLYTDQAHYIHTFRKITKYTPQKYKKTFNV